MLALAAFTGATYKSFEFTGKISKLIIRQSNNAGIGSILDMNGLLYIQSSQNGKRFTSFDKVPLLKLAELCSMDRESSIKVNTTSSFSGASPEVIAVPTLTLCEYVIDLTADGKGIPLGALEKWVMDLTGLTAGDTYNVWAIESSESTTMPITYGVHVTGAFKNFKFQFAGVDRVAITKDGSITDVEISDAFGNVKKPLDELSAEIRNGYGAVYHYTNTLSNLSSTYAINEGLYCYLIPYDGKTDLQLNTSGAASVEVISMKW